MKGSWVYYNDLKFNTKAPIGNLPSSVKLNFVEELKANEWEIELALAYTYYTDLNIRGLLFSRVNTCIK